MHSQGQYIYSTRHGGVSLETHKIKNAKFEFCIGCLSFDYFLREFNIFVISITTGQAFCPCHR